MTQAAISPILDPKILGTGVVVRQRSIDRFALAHDASHYLLVPDVVLVPETAEDVAKIFRATHAAKKTLTFRSGGTSLSGQGVSDSILVDTRSRFQNITVVDGGKRVCTQPGVTIRQVNAHLLRHGHKLGPDPASEIACTIGGVVANNSSGMACGIEHNTYQTLESMVFVLPSGTIIDSADADADAQLRSREPDLYRGITELRERIHANPESVAEIKRQYSHKNTMGYGLNSFVDFTRPLDILSHLFIGSEGTLGFVAEARFRTIEIKPFAATGLLIFSDLSQATSSLTDLVATGLATIELMDAQSLRAAQRQSDCPRELSDLTITHHAALLVEFQSSTSEELDKKKALAETVFSTLPVIHVPQLTSDQETRAALWRIRKGLFAAVAEARPSGTSALLEDISVPVEKLRIACESLTSMFEAHGYENSVIFGHAKDGNIHFMLNERFGDPDHLARYETFTAEMVDLVLGLGGSLKAEHGTGRIMAPFVRRQFGDELYDVMKDIKALCDPHAMLSPGVMLSDDPRSYVKDLKVTPTIEKEVDRCVECGYCEPACPSKDITLTPRQRIVLRREMQDAEDSGNTELLTELRDDFEYDGVETCAVDGMCMTACPVDINTGDLVRRLRQESRSALGQKIGKASATNWGPITRLGGYAMNLAHALPAAIPIAVTKVGRALLGDDVVPLYDRGLPGGGHTRAQPAARETDADVVFFSSCISTMFGPAKDSMGVNHAFLALCERAGIRVRISENSSSLCCGTPWKSKGYSDGYEHMSSLVIPELLTASDGGKLPIVSDAASCTEGLATMSKQATQAGLTHDALTFVDVIEFAEQSLLPLLTVTKPVGSIVIHHTCSTSQLGIDGASEKIARFVANEVHVPVNWGCCAFAGDRGMLHPELTASATQAEAAEVLTRDFDEYVSANRTCEIGMTRATGHEYRHILEVLEEATR